MVLNQIKKAANYNSKKLTAGNGICITIKYVTTRTGAQRSATFSKWDGKTCKGATGYAGTFTTCKN